MIVTNNRSAFVYRLKALLFLFVIGHCYGLDVIHAINAWDFFENKDDSSAVLCIKNHYDLQGQRISLPQGCILKFQGGSLDNGVVIGNSTVIEAPATEIFGVNLELQGDWVTTLAYPEWFGAIACEDKDAEKYAEKNRNAIQNCVDVFSHIMFANGNPQKKYYIIPRNGDDYIINISKRGRLIEGIDVDRTILETPKSVKNTKILYFSEPSQGARASDCLVQNLKIQHQDSDSHSNVGIYISFKCSGIRLFGIHLDCLNIGVHCESWSCIFKRVKCNGNYGFVFSSNKGLRTSISLENCSVVNARVGYSFCSLIYSNILCCSSGGCERALYMKDCSSIVFDAFGAEENKYLVNIDSCTEIVLNFYFSQTKKKADELAYSREELKKMCYITGNSSYITFHNCLFNIHKPASLQSYSDEELSVISVIRSSGSSPLLIYRACNGSFHETGTPVYNLISVDNQGGKYFERQSVVLENSAFTIGNSSKRPKLNNIYIGYQFYDTTLNRPIWYKGDDIWIDCNGKPV